MLGSCSTSLAVGSGLLRVVCAGGNTAAGAGGGAAVAEGGGGGGTAAAAGLSLSLACTDWCSDETDPLVVDVGCCGAGAVVVGAGAVEVAAGAAVGAEAAVGGAGLSLALPSPPAPED
jgi:hypothetical protein